MMKLGAGFGGLLLLYCVILAAETGSPDTGTLMTFLKFEGHSVLFEEIILTNAETGEEIFLRIAGKRKLVKQTSSTDFEQREGLILQDMPAGSYYISTLNSWHSFPVIRLKKEQDMINVYSDKITYIGDLLIIQEERLRNLKFIVEYHPSSETVKSGVKKNKELFSEKDTVIQIPGMDEPVPILRSALGIE